MKQLEEKTCIWKTASIKEQNDYAEMCKYYDGKDKDCYEYSVKGN